MQLATTWPCMLPINPTNPVLASSAEKPHKSKKGRSREHPRSALKRWKAWFYWGFWEKEKYSDSIKIRVLLWLSTTILIEWKRLVATQRKQGCILCIAGFISKYRLHLPRYSCNPKPIRCNPTPIKRNLTPARCNQVCAGCICYQVIPVALDLLGRILSNSLWGALPRLLRMGFSLP